MDITSEPGKGTDPLEADFEKQLANEGLTLEGRELPAPDRKPDAQPKLEPVVVPPKVEPKPDDKKPDEEVKSKPDESWRKVVAKKHEDKAKATLEENDRLKKEIEDLKKTPTAPLKPVDQPKPGEVASTLTDEQKTLAEKYGIEPEDYLKMFPSKVIEKEVVKGGLSPEQEALLNSIQSDKEQLAITEGFRSDFETNVLPLIRAEYPNISDEKVKEIKSKIFDKINTDAYSMTPLSTLYKGEDEFRGVVTTPKKSFDEGSKVPANTGNKVYDFETVTDADMQNSDFPFEKYSNYMASKEKGAKRN